MQDKITIDKKQWRLLYNGFIELYVQSATAERLAFEFLSAMEDADPEIKRPTYLPKREGVEDQG